MATEPLTVTRGVGLSADGQSHGYAIKVVKECDPGLTTYKVTIFLSQGSDTIILTPAEWQMLNNAVNETVTFVDEARSA